MVSEIEITIVANLVVTYKREKSCDVGLKSVLYNYGYTRHLMENSLLSLLSVETYIYFIVLPFTM